MVIYKRCTEANEDAIYQAFQNGFSDSILKIDLPKDLFMNHFFGPEGNSLEYSVIALDGEKPIGLNLGGIREFDGLKTLRCGALCVHPDYRGTGVGTGLFECHKEIALSNNCRQMFLEVITVLNPYGYEENLKLAEFFERTNFRAYNNMPLILRPAFAFGLFERNTIFVLEKNPAL